MFYSIRIDCFFLLFFFGGNLFAIAPSTFLKCQLSKASDLLDSCSFFQDSTDAGTVSYRKKLQDISSPPSLLKNIPDQKKNTSMNFDSKTECLLEKLKNDLSFESEVSVHSQKSQGKRIDPEKKEGLRVFKIVREQKKPKILKLSMNSLERLGDVFLDLRETFFFLTIEKQKCSDLYKKLLDTISKLKSSMLEDSEGTFLLFYKDFIEIAKNYCVIEQKLYIFHERLLNLSNTIPEYNRLLPTSPFFRDYLEEKYERIDRINCEQKKYKKNSEEYAKIFDKTSESSSEDMKTRFSLLKKSSDQQNKEIDSLIEDLKAFIEKSEKVIQSCFEKVPQLDDRYFLKILDLLRDKEALEEEEKKIFEEGKKRTLVNVEKWICLISDYWNFRRSIMRSEPFYWDWLQEKLQKINDLIKMNEEIELLKSFISGTFGDEEEREKRNESIMEMILDSTKKSEIFKKEVAVFFLGLKEHIERREKKTDEFLKMLSQFFEKNEGTPRNTLRSSCWSEKSLSSS